MEGKAAESKGPKLTREPIPKQQGALRELTGMTDDWNPRSLTRRWVLPKTQGSLHYSVRWGDPWVTEVQLPAILVEWGSKAELKLI